MMEQANRILTVLEEAGHEAYIHRRRCARYFDASKAT